MFATIRSLLLLSIVTVTAGILRADTYPTFPCAALPRCSAERLCLSVNDPYCHRATPFWRHSLTTVKEHRLERQSLSALHDGKATKTIHIGQRTNGEKREPQLLEIGQAKKVIAPSEAPRQMKIVSYNIRWRGGDDLEKLIQFLRSDPEIGGARIIGLQEVDRNKKRTGNKNTVKVIAEELGMYYAWAAPPVAKAGLEEETGVAILSPYPLTDIHRLVLPHDGPGGRRRAALGATITAGSTRLRFYSVHSETRIAVDKKMDQLKAVFEDLEQQPKGMPTIVLGDFNTWEGSAVKKTFKLFKQEGFQTPFDDRATFCRQIVFFDLTLKLDWIWVRNLETKEFGINRKIKLSDHWPLWLFIETKPEPSQ